jgi:sacsin
MRQRELDSDTVKISLRLLDALADTDTSPEEYARILIPDSNGSLRPINQVYYNDLDEQACFVSLPEGTSVAHPELTSELAKRLRLTSIGHLGLKSLILTDHDMGEPLTVRIRGVLLQYKAEQAFTEFLANAADAGAKTFGILLDDRPAEASRTLSLPLAELQKHPSLIIYNDAVFKDDDFHGILDVALGGKIGRSDTTGQFGLGVLSMYHFAEVSPVTVQLGTTLNDEYLLLDGNDRIRE